MTAPDPIAESLDLLDDEIRAQQQRCLDLLARLDALEGPYYCVVYAEGDAIDRR